MPAMWGCRAECSNYMDIFSINSHLRGSIFVAEILWLIRWPSFHLRPLVLEKIWWPSQLGMTYFFSACFSFVARAIVISYEMKERFMIKTGLDPADHPNGED